MNLYSSRDVAELLDWPRDRIYAYVRAGLIAPERDGNRYRFEFQDLVILRAARELIDAGLPARRVKRSLSRLQDRLSGNRPLSALSLGAAGEKIVVREGSGLWEIDSGQGQLDFEHAPAPGVAECRRPSASEPDLSAESYNLGLDLEEQDPVAAIQAYGRAIELDDRHADAHINLGRLHQNARELDAAERHYRAALRLEPDNPIAHFNLGTLLEDRGRREDAIVAYEAASSAIAEAHLNLARLYAAKGDQPRAIRHLRTVRFWSRD